MAVKQYIDEKLAELNGYCISALDDMARNPGEYIDNAMQGFFADTYNLIKDHWDWGVCIFAGALLNHEGDGGQFSETMAQYKELIALGLAGIATARAWGDDNKATRNMVGVITGYALTNKEELFNHSNDALAAISFLWSYLFNRASIIKRNTGIDILGHLYPSAQQDK
ncbi:MAG: hypothetical protein KJ709_08270 [Nanoarchaeota archaeon]|nr:hypothetical protein [Nanoarchaeota archaeon]